MRLDWEHCNVFVLNNFNGGKSKESKPQCIWKAGSCVALLSCVCCGLVTLNYHIQFYGLFYEKMLFSLLWIAVKRNRKVEEDFCQFGKNCTSMFCG